MFNYTPYSANYCRKCTTLLATYCKLFCLDIANNRLILSQISHITVEGGKTLQKSTIWPNFFMFKLAKQGALISLFFTIFKPKYAHERKK